MTDGTYDACDLWHLQQFYGWNNWDLNQFIGIKYDRCATYGITKLSRKKKVLQNNDFLFVWNANLII